MSQYVNLEMSYNTFLELCSAVEKATTHTEGFDEIQKLVHLVDFLEKEYERDCGKQNLDYETWMLHEELFRNKELYHHEYFYPIKEVFDEYNHFLKITAMVSYFGDNIENNNHIIDSNI